jgi:hypothetical protein
LDSERYALREIGEEMGISPASVCQILKAYRKDSKLEVL